MLKKLLIVGLFYIMCLNGNSQDVHFSQFGQNPMMLNPAYTGMYEGNFRFNLNYKNQWATVGNVYETYAASTDYIIFKNSMGLKSTGLGVAAYQDVAGSSKTKTTRVDLNLSQTVYLSKNSDLTLGIGFSYMDMSANYTGLNWGSQYNGVEFDQSIGSGELFTGYAEKTFDLSSGMIFRLFDDKLYPLEIGFSAYHINQPKIRLLSQEDFIPARFIVNASKEFDYPTNQNWGFKFVGYASTQRRAREIIVGGLMRKDFGMVSKYTGYYNNINVYFGAYYRVGDAIIPLVQVTVHKKLTVGMSYDFTLSRFSQASLFRGGAEFSFSYLGPFRPIAVVSPKKFD